MAIEVTTITLAFDPLLEGFPNERLRDYLADRELLSVESFPFEAYGDGPAIIFFRPPFSHPTPRRKPQ